MEQRDIEAEGKRRRTASKWPLGLNPVELAARQDLYNGFGNGLALAFELALVPVIFGLMGYGLDRWLGLLPVLTIVFVLIAVFGLSVRQFAAYTLRMKVHENEGPWSPDWSGSPTTTDSTPLGTPPAPARGGPAGRQQRRHAQRQVAS